MYINTIGIIALVIGTLVSTAYTQQVGFISSYKISPGLQLSLKDHDHSEPISVNVFTQIAEKTLKKCNAYAYIFVNQPGIVKRDFIENEHLFPFFQQALDSSSSIARFENIDYPLGTDHEMYLERLMRITRLKCDISNENIMYVEGNNTASFQPYMDTDPKIIRIDFPELPSYESTVVTRDRALKDYDAFLNYVLSKLPTPEYTLIYTSSSNTLSNNTQDEHDEDDDDTKELEKSKIFASVFDIPSRSKEFEKNDYGSKTEKPKFKEYEPLMQSQIDKQQIYPTVFDRLFWEENKDIFQKIIASVIISITVYFFSSMATPKTNKPTKSKPAMATGTTAKEATIEEKETTSSLENVEPKSKAKSS